ncbi:MAG: helix-turn-helix domain containing protein, partial [Candidatus Nanopelagicales bacterium]
VMTVQPPLPLALGGVEIGDAVAVLVDADGGRVFVHGVLSFAWDAGDAAGRVLAAVQLVRTRAATGVDVAAGFGMGRETLRRWVNRAAESGVAGVIPAKRGPKGPSKVTPELAEEMRSARSEGATLAVVADRFGVSVASVRRAEQAAAGTSDLEPAVLEPAVLEPAVLEPAVTVPEDRIGPVEAALVLPVLADPVPRGAERAAARAGLLQAAAPVFTGCARAPLVGLFLALPGLAGTGLLECANRVYAGAPGGFYSLDTMLLEAVFRALAGEPRAEGASRIDPVALGRVLGLDRAPEVKTIRRRIGALASLGRAAQLQAAVAAHHLATGRPDDAVGTLLYVDGHVRAYSGTRKVAKTHSARLRFPAPATVETWIADHRGDPVLVVMAEPSASLAGELRRLIPALRAAVGDDRRVLVGFDRGGWSPALFAHLHAHGFDTLTWRKGPIADVDPALFAEVAHTDPDTGTTHTWQAADTTIELPIADTGRTFGMRQITRITQTRTGPHQGHVLTTRTDLPAGEVLHRMGSRWRLENYFRYARIHFDLDAHDSYTATDDDPDRAVPNPARATAHQALLTARDRYDRAAAHADTALLALHTPPPGVTTFTISNADITRATAGLHLAADQLAAAEAAHAAVPARLPLGQVHPGQQVLDTQTKLITHAIRMAAFNTITALARDIRINTGYPRAADEAHTLARQALAASGDIQPGNDTLTITLDPLPTRRATAAIAELAAHLTTTATRYPGTDLTLRYAVKDQP